MKSVCAIDQCTGCMACVDVCPKDAIEIKDDIETYNAVINLEKCIGCNACAHVCQNLNAPVFSSPVGCYQGWVKDQNQRKKSSSGGLAAAVERSFIIGGGVVFSCVFSDGEFIFKKASGIDEVDMFCGSKYVKSNPSGVYKEIKELLNNGVKVLFVGLPCQVDAIKQFVGKKLWTNLYTVDLICHGTPSPKLLEIFLKQYNILLKDLKGIRFRNKSNFRVSCEEKTITVNGTCDCYSTAYLGAVCYTRNCYNCQFARKERVSDFTLGDAWGMDIAYDDMKKGASVILVQSQRGEELLKSSDVFIEEVDIAKAIKGNNQLKEPTKMPKQRNNFFRLLSDGVVFNKIVWKCFPWVRIKQSVKAMLIKSHIMGGTVK